jgi:hypothetical protein
LRHRWINVRRHRGDHRGGGPSRELVAADWESERAIRRPSSGGVLDDARRWRARPAYGDELLPAPLPGGAVRQVRPISREDAPGPQRTVTIPETGFNIAGYIDRPTLPATASALVRDHKTGRRPDRNQLDGGKELQRCLCAFAVKALLGNDVAISTSLLFPRNRSTSSSKTLRRCANSTYLGAAGSVVGGAALPVPHGR